MRIEDHHVRSRDIDHAANGSRFPCLLSFVAVQVCLALCS